MASNAASSASLDLLSTWPWGSLKRGSFRSKGTLKKENRKGTPVQRLRRTLVSLGAVAAFVMAAGWNPRK